MDWIMMEDGDYWPSVDAAIAAGWREDQIWSVAVADCEDDATAYCYGPSHHWVNVIGYVVTTAPHDGGTYIEETMELDYE